MAVRPAVATSIATTRRAGVLTQLLLQLISGAAVETAWAPQDTEELLDAIATQDYGVSDDRSSKLTAPALRAYNQALKSEYGHYELRRGRTLHDGFTIVKVSASGWRTVHVLCCLRLLAARIWRQLSTSVPPRESEHCPRLSA